MLKRKKTFVKMQKLFKLDINFEDFCEPSYF
jgi:hypothetical protein